MFLRDLSESADLVFEPGAKFFKILPSKRKLEPNDSKKDALFSLDWLLGNEPFQWFALTRTYFFPPGRLAAIKLTSPMCNVRASGARAFGVIVVRRLANVAVMPNL